MASSKTSITVVTIYLFVYAVLVNIGIPLQILPYLYISFPFLLCWMVICILKDANMPYPKLGKKEEWGYRDKQKDELGLF